jgi:hypothetical protein
MKQDYSVKDILNAVDDILKIKSIEDSKKKTANETSVKDILILKPIQGSTTKIINKIYVKNDTEKEIINNPESKKINEMKKKYDLLVVNNAKDILILNRIIFK